jgi:hypothetical protein
MSRFDSYAREARGLADELRSELLDLDVDALLQRLASEGPEFLQSFGDAHRERVRRYAMATPSKRKPLRKAAERDGVDLAALLVLAIREHELAAALWSACDRLEMEVGRPYREASLAAAEELHGLVGPLLRYWPFDDDDDQLL